MLSDKKRPYEISSIRSYFYFANCVELSYLTVEEQTDLLEAIGSEDCTHSHAQSIRMRNLSKEGNLDIDAIFDIMTEEKGNQKEI